MQEHKECVLNDKIIIGSANMMFSGKHCVGATTEKAFQMKLWDTAVNTEWLEGLRSHDNK